MLFKVVLTLPANTTKTAYVQKSVQLLPGTVAGIDVRFPPGCCDLVGVAIFEKERQLWPDLAEDWISGDTFPVSWQDDFVLEEKPYVFDIRGFNLDTDYPHTVSLYINILTGNQGWAKYLKQLLGV